MHAAWWSSRTSLSTSWATRCSSRTSRFADGPARPHVGEAREPPRASGAWAGSSSGGWSSGMTRARARRGRRRRRARRAASNASLSGVDGGAARAGARGGRTRGASRGPPGGRRRRRLRGGEGEEEAEDVLALGGVGEVAWQHALAEAADRGLARAAPRSRAAPECAGSEASEGGGERRGWNVPRVAPRRARRRPGGAAARVRAFVSAAREAVLAGVVAVTRARHRHHRP